MAEEPTVTRKVYFCRAIPRINDDPERDSVPTVPQFDPTPIFDYLESLDPNERQLERGDGDLTFCRILSRNGNPRVQLSTVRMAEIPQSFDRLSSSFERLDLAETEGIAESTHMIFFPNNIMGLEYNYRGPGAGRLEQYFRSKAPIQESNVSFAFLKDRDHEAKINSLQEIRELDVRVSDVAVEGTEDISEDVEGKNFRKAVKGMKQVGTVEEYGLTWKTRKGSHGQIPHEFMNAAKDFLRAFGHHDENAKLIVRGKDEEGHVQRINILNDRLMWEKKVLKISEADRGVRPDSAFQAIEELYEQHKGKIERALNVHF